MPVSFHECVAVHWQAYLEELRGNTLEGVGRPLTKPVNGTAVHQTGELAQTCPAVSHAELPSQDALLSKQE